MEPGFCRCLHAAVARKFRPAEGAKVLVHFLSLATERIQPSSHRFHVASAAPSIQNTVQGSARFWNGGIIEVVLRQIALHEQCQAHLQEEEENACLQTHCTSRTCQALHASPKADTSHHHDCMQATHARMDKLPLRAVVMIYSASRPFWPTPDVACTRQALHTQQAARSRVPSSSQTVYKYTTRWYSALLWNTFANGSR